MVQVWGAGRAPRLAPRLALPGKAGAGGARSGLASLAGCEGTGTEESKRESGRDWERPTRNRIADGYSIVKSKVSIRNDLHSLPGDKSPPAHLRPELPQVVVQVFVHPAAPNLRRERAKERVRMPCALRFSALLKLPQAKLELFLFSEKIPLIRHHKARVGGVVPREWLLVRIDGPDE